MKKIKLLALLMAVVMLSACLVSCNSGGSEKATVKTTVTLFVNDEIAFGPASNELEYSADAQPTVLQCVKEIFILNDVACEDDGKSFTSINGLTDKEEGDYTYYWEFTINGVAPESGRAGTITANEGDVVVYTYVKVLTSELIAAEEAKDKD